MDWIISVEANGKCSIMEEIMYLVSSVGEVHTCNVHAGLDHLLQGLHRSGGRSYIKIKHNIEKMFRDNLH